MNQPPRRSARLQGLAPDTQPLSTFRQPTRQRQPVGVSEEPEEDLIDLESKPSGSSLFGSDEESAKSDKPRSGRSRKSRTRSVASTASSTRRRRETELEAAIATANLEQQNLDLEVELEKKKVELEKKALERKKKIQQELIKKQMEVKLAQIDEESDRSLHDYERSTNSSQKLSDWEEEPEPTKKPALEPSVKLLNIHKCMKNRPPEDQLVTRAELTKGTDRLENVLTKTLEIIQHQATMQKRNEVRGSPASLERKQESARRTIGRDPPSFSGNPEGWPTFIRLFSECTKLCGFSQSEDLLRLNKCLSGKAKEAVQGLLSAPENVPDILKTLELRFGKPEFVIETLIEKARKCPAMSDGKFESIIEFSTVLKNLATTIVALKRKNHLCNPSLLKELEGKLPNPWKTDWSIHIMNEQIEEVTVKDFSNWMAKRSEALSRLHVPKTSKEDKPIESTPKGRDKFKRKETVLAISAADSSADKKPAKKRKCYFCEKDGHGLWECSQFAKKEISEKWDFVKTKKLCFSCLIYGHQTEKCQLKKVCGKNGCEQHHHRYLHFEKTKTSPSPKTTDTPTADGKNEKEAKVHSVLHTTRYGRVLLKVVPVILKGPAKSMKTYALLDEGAVCTLIDDAVASELGLDGPNEPFTIRGVNDIKNHEEESRAVALKISGVKDKRTYEMKGVRTVSNLGLPHQSMNVKELPDWVNMKGIDLESLQNAKPTILIGLDNGHLIVTEKLKRGPKNSWLLGKTRIGWALYGNTAAPQEKNLDGFTLCHFENHDEELHQLVKESFSTESFGVKVIHEKLRSKEDERAHSIMESTTRRIGDHWETGLIWKWDEIKMPESKMNAMKRLESMEKKMDKDPVLAAEYVKKIQSYVDAGYARYLSSEEAAVTNSRTWYLPHFGVINLNKPGKMRFVFDAAAKSRGICLNDTLLPGPDLLTSLPGCLTKFRQKKIGFSGDIAEFFHRIQIREEDQNSQRFLWRGLDRDRKPDTLVMKASIFGAACSPFTSQAAKNKNAEEFKDEFPEASTAITRRHYMDDYLDSADSVEDAVKIIRQVIAIHKKGDFHIGKFVCSSKEVLQSIPRELRGSDESLEMETDMALERVLGLSWNPNADTLGFNLKFHKVDKAIVYGERRPTKREVLKVVMSVFDPLGLLAHYTVQGKILLQDIWRSGCGWDDQLNDDLNNKWQRWIQQLENVPEFKVRRCFAPEFGEDAIRHLHIFCDASGQSFSTVAFLRSEKDGEVDVSIVMAKTRVAPLKVMTIPKLELQAALMGSRLANFIKAGLEISVEETHYWSDSMTVLRWLRSDGRQYKIFVGNRIGEILEVSDVADWHWVPTKLNVADDATRDDKPADLSPSSRWIHGPPFLKQGKDHWPEQKLDELRESPEEELEQKSGWVNSVPEIVIGFSLPDPNRFSSWLKLVRATGWMLRFVKKCKNSPKSSNAMEISVAELEDAEILWIRYVQALIFTNELNSLRQGQPVAKTSRLAGLSPILDSEGIIRMDGRIKAAPDLNENAKMPIILPNNVVYIDLLIMEYHRRAGHHGRERVLNDLRQKYWILDMRRAVKRSWTKCQRCKNARAKPIPPEMGQLPLARLTPNVRPFTFCGVDYFGPMEVSIGRRHEKRYGVLFTCLTMRAVHLEIAASLSTDSCIMGLRRMISRRGAPREMYSDNGTNFHGANNELKAALMELDQERIQQELTPRGVEWKFIPPGSPHMGGCWERLVRSVKTALSSVLKERAPREEILQTVFAEAEFTVNSRPLTYASVEPENPRPLTPNDLLIGPGVPLPPGKFTDTDFYTRKMWRYSQRLADNFWTRWMKEYLPTLTRRTKWHQRAEPIKVGDIAVILDETLERNHWPRGRIMNVFPGKDGQVRIVEVRTQHGVYKRPVTKVAVLDLNVGVDPEDATPGGRMSRTAQED